jgi:hypothetical protein
MKEFRNKAWEHWQKMEEIFPLGGASGASTHHGTTQKAYEGSPQSVISVPPVAGASYGTSNPEVGLSTMDQQALMKAANTVSMAIQSLDDISLVSPSLANMPAPSITSNSLK